MKLKKYIKGPLITLFTVLLLLAVGEVLVRLFSDIRPPLTVRTSKLGNIYRPNFNGHIFGDESQKRVAVRINRDGFRGPDRPYNKPTGTVRIAVLGDSMIAAMNTAEDETLVAVLEKMLNEKFPNGRFEVFNFGVSGASTGQEYNLYREVVRKYEPDAVICAYFSNDFGDNCRRLSWNPRVYMDFDDKGQLHTIHVAQERISLAKWLNTHSRLYVWQRIAVNNAIRNLVTSGYAGKDNKIRGGWLIFENNHQDEDLAYAWRLNRAIIQEFYATVTADGAHFLFVYIPDGFELYEKLWADFKKLASGTVHESHIEREWPEKQLREIVSEKDIPSLFLADGFKKHLDEHRPKNEDYWLNYESGGGHLNEAGNAVGAKLTFDYLVEQPWFCRLTESNTQ